MGTDGWRKGITLDQSLQERSNAFQFLQAVRLLDDAGDGDVVLSLDRTVKFQTVVGQEFPTSEIKAISRHQGRYVVELRNFGLAGPIGPMPQEHSSWIYGEEIRGRPALRQFLDLFNHRLIVLLYLAKKRCNEGLQSSSRRDTDLYRYLASVSGQWQRTGRNTTDVRHSHIAAFGGLLTGDRVNLSTVENIVSSTLSMPAKVRHFNGRFVEADQQYRCRLGSDPKVGSRLGSTVILGKKVWNEHHGIIVDVGPTDYETMYQLQPGSELYARFVDLLRYITGGRWEIELNIMVRKGSIPESRFTGKGMRLGYSSWLTAGTDTESDELAVSRRVIKPAHYH